MGLYQLLSRADNPHSRSERKRSTLTKSGGDADPSDRDRARLVGLSTGSAGECSQSLYSVLAQSPVSLGQDRQDGTLTFTKVDNEESDSDFAGLPPHAPTAVATKTMTFVHAESIDSDISASAPL